MSVQMSMARKSRFGILGWFCPWPSGRTTPKCRTGTLADRLKAAGTQFIIEPYIRFKGQVGEQATMFFMDPFGNAIEFKAMANPDYLFAK